MRRVILAVILSAVLTGCGGGSKESTESKAATSPTPSGSAAPSRSPSLQGVCGKSCDGEEVISNLCGSAPFSVREAVDLSPGKPGTPLGVDGVLVLRTANPSACDHIFWARFDPGPGMTANWKVTIATSARHQFVQKSVPRKPRVSGFTKGLYAESGETITFCVVPGNRLICRKYEV